MINIQKINITPPPPCTVEMLLTTDQISKLNALFPKLEAEILGLGWNPRYIKSATGELVIFAILDAIEQLPAELREKVEARIRSEDNLAEMPEAITTNALEKLNSGWVRSKNEPNAPYDGCNILKGFYYIRYIINKGIDAFGATMISNAKFCMESSKMMQKILDTERIQLGIAARV